MEKFFVSYIKENNLDYKIKDRVYTVKLDKLHKKLYSTEDDELKCTFDANIAKKRGAELIGLGTFIFDSMISKYSGEINISNLEVPFDDNDILDVNDKIKDLNKTCRYMIDEKDEVTNFIAFETTINTANNKQTISNQILITKEIVVEAKDFENNQFKSIKEDLSIDDKSIDKGLKFIEKIHKSEINKYEKEHYKDMEELKRIQTTHAEDQYKELQEEEDQALNKIEEAKSNAISASSFDTKDKWNTKAKQLKQKHEKLVEANKKKREKIKQDFDKQISELECRELNVNVKITSYANVKMHFFKVNFDDGDVFYYFPTLKQFFKK